MKDLHHPHAEDALPGQTAQPAIAPLPFAVADKPLESNADLVRATHIDHAAPLLDRARARREKALTDRDQGIATRIQDLTSRDLCIVQTTTDGRSVTNHIFPEVPRLGTLITRTGPDVFVLSVRVQTPDS